MLNSNANSTINNIDKFVIWTQSNALPYWAEAANDPDGGVYECLNMDGTPINDIARRVRVQARYAYVYAHAGKLGWFDKAKYFSDHAWDYLLESGCQGGEETKGGGFKGCAHLLNSDGSLQDGMRDTYAQAFVILAGAWRYMAFNDRAALEIAKQTLEFLDTHLKAENGGWYEGIPSSLPRRQNPHMHLFEALLALYDATLDEFYLERAGEIFLLFKTVFFDHKNGILLEFFSENWKPVGNQGGPIEPGHMMEWCWLLREYEKRAGEDVSVFANVLYNSAIKYGLHSDLGLLCDRSEIGGQIDQLTFRMWPQLEYLKASVAQHNAGHQGLDSAISSVIENIFKKYLAVPILGGWVDQLNDQGKTISSNMPTSTFYHLLCAAAIADQHRSQN